jgi:hypothetical protein
VILHPADRLAAAVEYSIKVDSYHLSPIFIGHVFDKYGTAQNRCRMNQEIEARHSLSQFLK